MSINIVLEFVKLWLTGTYVVGHKVYMLSTMQHEYLGY